MFLLILTVRNRDRIGVLSSLLRAVSTSRKMPRLGLKGFGAFGVVISAFGVAGLRG